MNVEHLSNDEIGNLKRTFGNLLGILIKSRPWGGYSSDSE